MSVEFVRTKRPTMALDLAPLIDVVFLLLVFFMLTSSFLPPALPVELPVAGNEESAPAEPVVIVIASSGEISLNGEAVALAGLAGSLAEALAESESKALHVRGDRAAPYGVFLEVMDVAKAAGASRLHLVHEAK
jgi:biopolymer transport protein ExbD